MSEKTNILLTPFQIGRETIKNRMVMGPMAVSQLFDSYGAFNDEGIEFYTERAKGGFASSTPAAWSATSPWTLSTQRPSTARSMPPRAS